MSITVVSRSLKSSSTQQVNLKQSTMNTSTVLILLGLAVAAYATPVPVQFDGRYFFFGHFPGEQFRAYNILYNIMLACTSRHFRANGWIMKNTACGHSNAIIISALSI